MGSRALHGGAPAALIATAFERHEPMTGMQVTRFGVELLRPVPFAPLILDVRTLRPGRRVQELAAELHAETAEGAASWSAGPARCACGSSARTSRPHRRERSRRISEARSREGRPVRFALNAEVDGRASRRALWRCAGSMSRPCSGRGASGCAFAIRWSARSRRAPLRDWRLRPTSATGSLGPLPFDRYLFINADLHVHLHRQPRGDWIGIDARTLLHPGGTVVAESVLHDLDGPVGRAFQALVVSARR